MLCGGSEAAVTPLSYAGFCNMKAMCTDMNDNPQKASRPFDSKRSGFIMGEGSGTLVLESEAHAKARGARIYCELGGYGATCDAHHITAPHPEGEGLAAALDAAILQAGIAKVGICAVWACASWLRVPTCLSAPARSRRRAALECASESAKGQAPGWGMAQRLAVRSVAPAVCCPARLRPA
jgi:hypothetical protein